MRKFILKLSIILTSLSMFICTTSAASTPSDESMNYDSPTYDGTEYQTAMEYYAYGISDLKSLSDVGMEDTCRADIKTVITKYINAQGNMVKDVDSSVSKNITADPRTLRCRELHNQINQ